jgi:hypothetical protein
VLTGSLTNNGLIALLSNNAATDILIDSQIVTLSGTGTIWLNQTSGDTSGNAIIGASSSDELDNTNSLIEGGGNLGGGTLTLVNGGTIDANSGYQLLLDTGPNIITNTGLIEATAGNGLVLLNTAINCTTGTLLAANADIFLQGGVIDGGTLTASGSGALAVAQGQTGTLNGTAVQVLNTGAIDIQNGGILAAVGALVNNGSVTLQSNNTATEFVVGTAGLTLSGSGTIAMAQATGDTNGNIITGAASTATFTNDSTIAGGGLLGDGTLTLINAGTINASSGYALVLNTGAIAATNTGLIESTGTGGLTIQTLVENSGGTIAAYAGNVDLNGGTIAGGTLASSGNGAILVAQGQTGTLNASANSITNTGGIAIQNGGTLVAAGALINDGAITLQSNNSSTEFVIGNSGLTLSGSGTLALSQNTGATNGNTIIGASAAATFTNDSTIAGGGLLGDGTLTLINAGTINASSGYALVLNTGAIAATNTGLIESTGTGGLTIQTLVENSGGTIAAYVGNVDLNGGTIAGGTLASSGNGAILVAQGQTGTLNASANSITNTGGIAIQNGGTLVAAGALINDGAITLQSNNSSTEFVIGNSGLTLSGSGTLALSQNTGATNGNTIIGASAAATFTNDSTIAGGGLLGDGTLTLINAGTINASSGYALVLNTGSVAVTNTGLLESTGSGGLIIETTVHNASGTIAAYSGSVDLNGGTIAGGTLASSGAGALVVDGGQTGTLDGSAGSLTNTGSIAIQIGGTMDVLGTIVNQGNITLYSNNATTRLIVESSMLTLSGGGTITLFQNSGDTVGDYLVGAAAGDTLDNISNTIAGGGYLGDGTLTLVNGGTINANSGYTLQLNTGSTGENLAGGVFLASGSGGLSIQNGAYSNFGLFEAENGSAIIFATGASLTNSANGTLTGGAYEAVATGNGATISVTGAAITTDEADIILSGSGSTIQFGGSAIDKTLEAIASGGTLSLANGRDFTASANNGDFTNSGLLTLAAAEFAATALTVSAGATVSGNGTLAGAVIDNGTITATGGTLVLTGAISGNGALQAVSGADLKLTASGTLTAAVSGAGTLELAGAFTLGTGALTISEILVDAGASLSGAGVLSANIVNEGTVAAQGGTLTVQSQIASGTLAADAGATLILAEGGSFAGTLAGSGTIALTTGMAFGAGAVLAGTNMIDTASLTIAGGATLTESAGANLALDAGKKALLISGGNSLSNAGTIVASGSGTAEIKTAFTNTGLASVTSGTLAFLGAVTNNGTLDAASGLMKSKQLLNGTGTLEIGGPGTLWLEAGAGAGQTVDFLTTAGLLELSKATKFGGTIENFVHGDQIDLLKAAQTSWSFTNNTLTIDDGKKTVASLHFGAGYTQSDFSVENSGTMVVITHT